MCLPLLHCWWECILVQLLWKAVWSFLKKLKTELPYNPVIPLLDIYLKEFNSGYNRTTCTPMFIAALFRISKLIKQHSALKVMSGLENVVYKHNRVYYSAIKKNEIVSFSGKWIELEIIMLSEVSQVQKHKGPMFSLTHRRRERKRA
jgi:hypothetical protein